MPEAADKADAKPVHSLMAEPGTVAAGVEAVLAGSPLPVTVKTRIGIDAWESYNDLKSFVARSPPPAGAASRFTSARPGAAASARSRAARCRPSTKGAGTA